MKARRRLIGLSAAGLAAVALVLGSPVTARAAQSTEPSVDSILSDARRLYEGTEYEGAVTALDRVVAQIDPKTSRSPAAVDQLAAAYELRGRARFGLNDLDGARADFTSLLRIDPARRLPADVSPRVVQLFADLKKALVGQLTVTLAPGEAELRIDESPGRAGTVALIAGQHVVTARRAGYEPFSEPVSVPPDGAIELSIVLRRVAGVASIVTSPPDVEILLDGAARGRTEPAGTSPESKPFLLVDISPGVHVVRVQKSCYVANEQRLQFQAADYRLAPVTLAPAVGALSVTGTSGGTVFLDGQPRGPAPLSLREVCEGPHVLEVRSATGRFVRRFDMRVGDTLAITADLRPALALLSVTGLPEGLRGGPDLRLRMEDVFRESRTFMLFAPPSDEVEQLLRREQLKPGWLSFDTARRPIGDDAVNITAPARQELSAKLAKALDVQGVAVVTAPTRGDTSDLLLTMLAAGSGQPDTVRLKLDDPESLARALDALDTTQQLFRRSPGVQVADVLDVEGAVVIGAVPDSVAQRAGVSAGDVVLRANGQAVLDASGLLKLFDGIPPDAVVALELRDRGGMAKRAEIRMTEVPQVVATVDRTLLSNKLLLDFRRRLNAAANVAEQNVARLNLAVALMRVGNWAEARAELEAVKLPDVPGVGPGTVLYLIGLCRAALGQISEADAAFRAASATKDSLLTAEGPPIKGLADRELADLPRRVSRPADR